ncbi:MAG: aldehyde ferredoxin oxidoreductase family protein [Christensenellales bacterium]|jgi:aldehyde:ferredoxin oxidoreductase
MSTKYGGYAGKVLKIDLSTREVSEYPFSDKERELYLGGKIMAAKIFYDYVKEKIDPLSPENMIVVSTGPLNALFAPSSSRFNISGISPLTGILTSSNCGGDFGVKLKMAGYDALVITGKSEEKIYITIYNDKVEFKNADKYWGMLTGEVQKEIQKDSADPKLNTGKIVIGPAGENLVRYACVVSDDRAAGRGGLGAVFGSKNLKGITAAGTHKPEPYNKEAFKELTLYWTKKLRSHPLTGNQLPKLGTAGLLTPMQSKHLLATKNFSRGQFEDFEKISGEEMAENHLVKNAGCTSCPIRCGRVVKVEGKEVKGPEVETLGLLGANILNNDIEKIFEWNYKLDELGMDTISTAGTLAFAMELNEKKLWDSGLEFGKTDNISEIIEGIARRSNPICDDLANGSRFLSQKYGGKDFAINAKGMELSAYEPRSAVGQGLGYAVSNRGGCHLNGGYNVVLEGLGLSINQRTPKGKASFTMTFQDLMEAVSAGGNCLFTTYAFFPPFLIKNPRGLVTRIVNKVAPHIGFLLYVAGKFPGILAVNLKPLLPHPLFLSAATGMKFNFGKMLRVGERGYTLERLINMRLGITAADDTLPKRLTHELQDENDKKSHVPIDVLRKNYYRCRSWNKNGAPKAKLVKRLGILPN